LNAKTPASLCLQEFFYAINIFSGIFMHLFVLELLKQGVFFHFFDEIHFQHFNPPYFSWTSRKLTCLVSQERLPFSFSAKYLYICKNYG